MIPGRQYKIYKITLILYAQTQLSDIIIKKLIQNTIKKLNINIVHILMQDGRVILIYLI